MKRTFIFLLMICLLMPAKAIASVQCTETSDYAVKRDILCLMAAYPGYITDLEKNTDGRIYLILKSGNKLIYDDRKVKSFGEKLSNPDLQDMLEQHYPLGPVQGVMKENQDPGRFRVYGLLREVYGSSRSKTEESLINISSSPSCRFSNCNKAADSLNNVMKELLPLARRNPRVGSCVYPLGGTYNYRLIAGTNQLSAHSFGIAIDLAVNSRDYWKWASRDDGSKRLSVYPSEIVEIFEKNNFIWGGKWSHFDIMHFEYRPEIIFKARYFSEEIQTSKPWYEGAPMENPDVKSAIEKIDDVIKAGG